MSPSNRPCASWVAAITVAAPAILPVPAQAAEVYVPLGVPGIGIGFAQPIGPLFAIRADFMTLGQRDKSGVEEGIRYRGDYRLKRSALLVDLFPLSGAFRVTAGATFNQYEIAMDGSGADGTLVIGDRTYTTSAADGLNVAIRFPKTTPYLGIGWGHQMGEGLRFSFDLGASIGKAKLSAQARGQLATQPDIQANIDKEVAQLQGGVGKLRALPQLSISLGYSF
jgi:hypothetical protein